MCQQPPPSLPYPTLPCSHQHCLISLCRDKLTPPPPPPPCTCNKKLLHVHVATVLSLIIIIVSLSPAHKAAAPVAQKSQASPKRAPPMQQQQQQGFNPDDILKHRLGRRTSQKAPVDLPPPPPPPQPKEPDWAPTTFLEKGQ